MMQTLGLYVKGFPNYTRARDITEYFFKMIRFVPNVTIPKIKDNQSPYAFVNFDNIENEYDFKNSLFSKLKNINYKFSLNNQVSNYFFNH